MRAGDLKTEFDVSIVIAVAQHYFISDSVNEPVAVASGQWESITVNVIVYALISVSLIVDYPTALPNPLLLDTS